MTDCPNAEMRDQLPDLLHGRLTDTARAVVLAHVGDCIDCQAEMELLKGLRGTMTYALNVNVARVSFGVIEQTRASDVPQTATSIVGRSRGRAWQNWRLAAAIAVLVVGGGAVARMSGGDRTTLLGDSTAVAQVVATPALQMAELSPAVDAEQPSESDLRLLLDDLQELDALPALEPEAVAVPVAPVERAVSERSE
jgi:hypothetical protein